MRQLPLSPTRGLIAIVGILALVLAGCGPSTAPPDAETPPPQPTEASAVITITFGTFEPERGMYQPFADAFNQSNPGIHVQLVGLDDIYRGGPSGDPNAQLRAIAGRADTAVSHEKPAQLQPGVLYDLKPLMDADSSFAPGDFFPGALESGTVAGSTVLLPSRLYPNLLYYNKDLWAARGLEPPRPDWTWRDLQAAAEQIARKQGGTVAVYGAVDDIAYIETLLAGLNLLSVPADQLRFDQPQVVEALERMAGLIDSGAFYRWPLLEQPNRDELDQLVRAGNAGMWRADILGGKGGLGKAPPFAVGIAAYPASTVPGSEPFGVEGYLMSGGTQHPEAAWAWLSFLSKQTIDTGRQAALPARKSLAEQTGIWQQMDEETRLAVQTTLTRPIPPPSPTADERLFIPLAQALDAVVAGTPAAQAAREAQAGLESARAEIQVTPTVPANQEPIVVATPAPDIAPAGATTITFAGIGKGDDQLRRLMEQFNQANPTIFVQVRAIDFSAGPPQPGVPPAGADCYMGFSPASASELSGTLDLQPLIDADTRLKLDDYPAALLAPYQDAGRLLGLPWQVGFRTLNYNQDAFTTAGLTPPGPDWTIDDFINAAQRLTTGAGNGKQYGFVMPRAQPEIVRFLIGLYGVALQQGSGSNLRPSFTDPAAVQAARAVVDLLRTSSPHTRLEGYGSNSGDRPYDELIGEGRAGMWFGNGQSPYGGEPRYGLAIAAPPLGQAVLTPDATTGIGLFIAAGTDKQQACWELLTFLSNGQSTLGLTPARRSAAESDTGAAVYQAYDTALQRPGALVPALQGSGPDTPDGNYYWFDRAIDRALQGADLERELALAQTLTEQFMTCRSAGGEAESCATQVDPEYQGA